jgi:hypothetical protein
MIGNGLIKRIFRRFLTILGSREHFGILAEQPEPEYL